MTYTQEMPDIELNKDGTIAKNREVKELQNSADQILADCLAKEGLTAPAMAKRLREALDLCLTNGKMTTYFSRASGRWEKKVTVDLVAYDKLLHTWEKWSGLGGANGNSAANFGDGLSEDVKKRLGKVVELFEAEIERRRISAVLPGYIESKDAEALPGVVGPGEIKPEVVD